MQTHGEELKAATNKNRVSACEKSRRARKGERDCNICQNIHRPPRPAAASNTELLWWCVAAALLGSAAVEANLRRLPLESEIGQVEVVEGLNVTLPCNVEHPPNDVPVLTLWYIGPEETPVYSYDQRPRSNSNSSDWSDPTVFGYNRVRFMPHWRPPALHFTNVNREDSRIYRCRIDFLHSNSRMAWIRLLVIVPTARLDLTVHQSPVMPGAREDVTCMASGGWPPARIIWLQDGQVVDANYKINKKKGISHNALEAGASSGDLLSPFVCQASNNDITTPLLTTYTRNVTFGPLSVMVEVSAWPQVEGVEVYLRCTVVGSNPPAKVQWFQHRRPLTRGTVNVTRVGDVTISVLRLVPMRELHGRQIVCRAENPMVIRSAVEDIVTLDVSYRPNATVTLVWPQIERNLQEGTKLLLQCHVDANPPPQTFAWLHNGQKLASNETLGLLLTWSHLTLQRATRDWSGAYQCAAANVEGEATSNTVVVNIKYAPRCLSAPSFRGLALFDPAEIDCAVDADPDNVTFRWTFTKSTGNDRFRLLPEHWYSSAGLHSTLKYVANSPGDFGEISCEATNAVGRQAVPCKTTLVSVGLPEEVRGCMVTNVTATSATINCMAGFDGGLKQSFQLQVWQSQNEELVFSDILESGASTKYANASRSSGNASLQVGGAVSEHDYDKYPIFGDGDVFQPEKIQFFVPFLKPNMHYFAEVTSMNSRGQARPKKFHIRTLSDGTEPPSSARPRPNSLPPKRTKLPPSQPATPAYESHTTHSYVQGLSTQEEYPNSRIFLWVMAVVLGVGLALFGVGFGVYMGKRQIVTCWYLTCGRLCRGGCCTDLRSGNCRCVGCWKRCKARCEDCIIKNRGRCTAECCKEQLTGCKCLRTCCLRFKPRGVPKFCQRDIKGEDEEGKPPVSCCIELSMCRKSGDDSEPTLDMASGLRGPALQLHRGGTLLLRRALSNTDSTAGSIKRKKDGETEGEGSYMNGMLEQTIYDSSGKYRGFAHIPSQHQVGARRIHEPINEAAPNSTSPSDPLLVNGKKLSFKETKPPAMVVKDKEESSTKKDPDRTAFEVEDRTVTDLTDPEEQRETEGANRDSVDSEGDRNRPGAPKFSAVLRNFRPPSLAKFVPKVKAAANSGCDV